MSHYHNDPYEREPLDSAHTRYDSPPAYPSNPPQSYSPSQTPYYDEPPTAPPQRSHHPSSHPDSAWNRMHGQGQDNSSHRTSTHSGSTGHEDSTRRAPSSPPRGDEYDNQSGRGGGGGGAYLGYTPLPPNAITPGIDNFSESASGGMAGIAYGVADRNPRNSGMDAIHSTGQVPPPPSRSQPPPQSTNAYSPQSSGYGYDEPYGAGGESHSSLAALGAAAVPPGSRSPSHRGNDGYTNDPYQGLTSRNDATHLGVFNPNEIADDGDDGLEYHRGQRSSMLSLSHSDRSRRAAPAAAAGAVGGAATGGLLSRGTICQEQNAGLLLTGLQAGQATP